MRGDEALRALPEAYVRALHLAAGGASDEELGDALGVPAASVPSLLQVGATKLEAILARRWLKGGTMGDGRPSARGMFGGQGAAMGRHSAARLVVVGVVLSGLLVSAASATEAEPGFAFRRIAGTDRFGTAALLAGDRGGAATVILASGLLPADGLAAAGVAGAASAPILLAAGDTLPATSAKAIVDANTSKVLLLGGPAALGTRLEAGLRKRGLAVERIAGGTRYATSEALAARLGPAGSIEGVPTAVVASGVTFADAVSVGPLAAARRLPVLLTPTNISTPAMEAALAASGARRVLVIGGTSAVRPTVTERLDELGFEVVRLAGANRSATSVAVADWAIEHAGFDKTRIAIARGDDVADALAVAPWAARTEPPTPVLVTPGRTAAGADLLAALARPGNLDSGTIIGGTGAITFRTETELLEAVKGAPAATGEPVENGAGVTPTTPTTPTTIGTPTPTTVPGAVLPPGTLPRPDPAAPSAQTLIAAALAAGTIDLARSLELRALALFGDPSLPPEFLGSGSRAEDAELTSEIKELVPTLPADRQPALRRFVLRPADPASYFSASRAGASFKAASPLDPSPRADPCTGGWTHKSGKHVEVWMCSDPLTDVDEKKIDEVVALTNDKLQPLVNLMGAPMTDGGSATDPANPNPLPDLYLVPLGTYDVRGNPGLPLKFVGFAVTTDLSGPGKWKNTSPSFMVMDRARVGQLLFSTGLVHEFFHTQQNSRIVARGGVECKSWLYESSARWADTHYVKPARARLQAEFVDGLETTDFPLPRGSPPGFQQRDPSSLFVGNPYNAFVWFTYLVQEAETPRIVRSIWDAVAQSSTCEGMTAQANAAAPFEEHFKGFALRNLNMKLAGDPIPKLYNGPGGSSEFPIGTPPKTLLEFGLVAGSQVKRDLILAPLSTRYIHLTSIPDLARRLVIDLSALAPAAEVDAWFVANDGGTSGGAWKLHGDVLRSGKVFGYDLCRDTPGTEDVRFKGMTEGWLILVNHSVDKPVAGAVKIRPRTTCFDEVTGTHTLKEEWDDGHASPWRVDRKQGLVDLSATLDLELVQDKVFADAGGTWAVTGGHSGMWTNYDWEGRVVDTCSWKGTYSGAGDLSGTTATSGGEAKIDLTFAVAPGLDPLAWRGEVKVVATSHAYQMCTASIPAAPWLIGSSGCRGRLWKLVVIDERTASIPLGCPAYVNTNPFGTVTWTFGGTLTARRLSMDKLKD